MSQRSKKILKLALGSESECAVAVDQQNIADFEATNLFNQDLLTGPLNNEEQENIAHNLRPFESTHNLLDIPSSFPDIQDSIDTSAGVPHQSEEAVSENFAIHLQVANQDRPRPSTNKQIETSYDSDSPYQDSESSYDPDNDTDNGDSESREELDETPNAVDQTKATDSVDNNNEEKSRGKRKKRNESRWQRNERKKKRMAGESYVSSSKSKKIIQKKELKEGCNNCRLKCNQNISNAQRQRIHKEFWNQNAAIDQKRQFVCSSIEEVPTARKRERTGKRSGKRLTTLKYFLLKAAQRTQVCQKYFLTTLGISQTFVRCAIEKRQISGIVTGDYRGRQPSANKIKDVVRNQIRQHIMSFPAVESHYSRRRSAKKYLGSHLNITKMYDLYKEDCQMQNVPPEDIGKMWLYSSIFNTEFNFSFNPPAKDTCDACDEFIIKLKEAESAEERQVLQTDYDNHLLDADRRYELKKTDQEDATNSNSEKVVMSDLQKCLPCPQLTNAQSFYSLKLWCFNYTVYDSTNKKATCVMWDESIAGRGGNEMASCLIRYVASLPNNITSLTIWSDNCPSQNRNVQMIMSYFYLLATIPHLNRIRHKFLLRGHTHMEVDNVHSIIERESKKCPAFKIITPWDWMQLARLSGKNKDMNVVEMSTLDFKDFNRLYNCPESPFQNCKKTLDNNKFLISKVVYMEVRRESPGILFFKKSYEDNSFESVDFNRKGGRRHISIEESVVPIRDTPNPISQKKYNDLQKLLKWIPKTFHPFYQQLVSKETVEEDTE